MNAREDRLRHYPLRELTYEELELARIAGYIDTAMYAAEIRRRDLLEMGVGVEADTQERR